MCQLVPNHLHMCGVDLQTVFQLVPNHLQMCGVDLQTVCQLFAQSLTDVWCIPTDCVPACVQWPSNYVSNPADCMCQLVPNHLQMCGVDLQTVFSLCPITYRCVV